MKKRIGTNSSTAIYLITVAVADSGLLLFFLLTDTVPANDPSVKNTYAYSAFFSYFGFPMFFFFIVTSIWLVVGVTVTRFIMVTFPLKAKQWCTNTRTYIGIGATLLCCFIINIPHFLNYRPMKTEINGTVSYSLGLTEYAQSGSAQRYEFWVHCMFLVLAPWLSVAVLNSLIIRAILKRTHLSTFKTLDKSNPKKCERQKQENQMTVVLLTVTFSFLVLLAWQCITQCFWMLGHGKSLQDSSTWNIVDMSFALAKMGVVINSSINCYLYCFSGSAFRKELVNIFVHGKGFLTVSSMSDRSTKYTSAAAYDNSTISESKA